MLLPTVAKQQRVRWLDYDKGITILLVVYGHCLDTMSDTVPDLQNYPVLTYLGRFLYGFRMPLFFLISGILVCSSLKKKGLLNYLFSRIELFYVMLIWGVIQITLRLWVHSPWVSYWSYLYLFIDPRRTGLFWYLNTFVCIGSLYAITTVKLKLKRWHQLGIGLILYTLSSYIYLNDINAGVITDISRYYLFFALGDNVSAWIQNENRQQKMATWQWFLPLLIAFLCLQYCCAYINSQHEGYGNFFVERKVPLLFLAEALTGCAFSLSLSFLLQKYSKWQWLTTVGSYSLYIYLMHQIVVSSIVGLLKHSGWTYAPALLFLVWAAGILLPVLFYNLAMRSGFWWLYSLHKPKIPANTKSNTLSPHPGHRLGKNVPA